MKRPYSALLVLTCFAFPLLLQAQQPFKQVRKNASPSQPAIQAEVIRGQDFSQQQNGPRARFSPLHLRNRLQPAAPLQLHEVTKAPGTGLPVFIQSQADPAYKQGFSHPEAAEAAAYAYLEEIKTLLHIGNPAAELVKTSQESDPLGFHHVRFQQYYQGIPVYGADLSVHFAPDGQRIFNGRYQPTPRDLSLAPALSAGDAIALAQGDLSRHVSSRPLSPAEQQLLGYSGPQATLVIYPLSGTVNQVRLAWHITLRPNFVKRWEYFIDAQSGDLLNHYDHTCSAGPTTGSGTDLNGTVHNFGVFEATNGTFYLMDADRIVNYNNPSNTLPDPGDGVILTADMDNTTTANPSFFYITSNNNSWSATSVSAHVNGTKSYDYYKSTFQRNSIDGNSGDIVSFINVADDNGGGLDNAFWNGQFIFYGNGNVAFRPLAGALDVAGHELTHGVIQETANLEYQGQSGALNESFADIFGVMIDRDDWTLGEEVVRSQYFPSGALRSMSDPHNGGSSLNDPGWQPKHMNEIYTGSQDNGGVHINSGIPNHAFYLFAQAIGKTKAEQVYYRALSQYLNRSSKFLDCRLAVVRAAQDLYGTAEVNAAKSAFDQVGIFDPGGGGTPGPSNLPTNPGQDYILSTDVNPFDPNTLYISDTGGQNYWPVSSTSHKRKASVTDDGRYALIVDDFGDIRSILLDRNNPVENRLTSDGFWDNVAISKDGSKLAGISVNIDTSIYVYDFNSQRWARFMLYNPTFSQGINSGGVLYADALEWDYSGEYLLYDAFNRIDGTFGSDIEYWDIGVIQVWDNQLNNFGSGEIEKFFTLDPGESIGNASFSKNSPFIIAFDYLNDNTGEYAVLASNLETGDIGQIFSQNVLGFPNYSKLDNKLIFSARSTQGDEVIAVIDLQNNKILPSGNPGILISDATWGIWYSTGSRVITDVDDETLAAASLQAFPNPFRQELHIRYEVGHPEAVGIDLFDLMGRKVQTLSEVQEHGPGEYELHLSLAELPQGAYFVRLQAGGKVQTLKVWKLD